jgi:hypothetical protein
LCPVSGYIGQRGIFPGGPFIFLEVFFHFQALLEREAVGQTSIDVFIHLNAIVFQRGLAYINGRESREYPTVQILIGRT